MEWNNGQPRTFFSRPPDSSSSLSFIYSYDQYTEVKQHPMEQQEGMVVPTIEKINNDLGNHHQVVVADKKKRLTSDQLDLLENSFQEEIKLDPDRKMKLARELGLQPRQIAVWFQNRRARWKAKQLERLYDSLKQEFDVVSKEKQKLQQEVVALRGILKDQARKTQISVGHTEISGEETVESTSTGNVASAFKPAIKASTSQQQITDCGYVFNAANNNNNNNNNDCNTVMLPYWSTLLPSYP